MKKANVLILDDSLLFREMLQREIERDINIKVVAKAADAFEAGAKINELKPDILIVDVVLGKLDGVEFVKQLLPQYNVPIIFISSNPMKRSETAQFKNSVFFQKPSETANNQYEIFFNQIRIKINSILYNCEPEVELNKMMSTIIAIGSSTGGAEALETVLSALPPVMPPIIISQHMPPIFTKTFSERLNAACKLSVKEGEQGDLLIPGMVYIAPGGHHMFIKHRDSKYTIQCEKSKPNETISPNIDKMFESVALEAKDDKIGIVLTGMGRDGAAGLLKIKQAGGKTFAQDKETSVIFGMPKAAYELGAVEKLLPLTKIAGQIMKIIS
ncbi:chemotaxis-specific protein-glutamate methyltransferase CheB [Eubacteriales bacterium OttesenSCG-928-G02]|nr:chemotaxis-specific protein-glutamate methyltransferase CheB [Eubacteriales bacterium OttesenSCG-928-G02]